MEQFVAGGSDGIPKVYRTFREVKREIGDDAQLISDLFPITGRVFAARFSADGKRIACAGGIDRAGELLVCSYDYTNDVPKELREIMGKVPGTRKKEETDQLAAYKKLGIRELARASVPTAEIYSVAFNADGGSVVAAAGSDGMIRFFNATNGKVTVEFPAVTIATNAAIAKTTKPIDYIRDVSPVIAHLGCNAGTCHGAKEGKNGFKLSLRGYDPETDLRAFTDDMASRRVNLASPDDSLMLLKAIAEVPHEGGRRMSRESQYYKILRQWIAEGAKLDMKSPRVVKIEILPLNPVVQEIGSKQQMQIKATYADGTMRDVTELAFVESGNTGKLRRLIRTQSSPRFVAVKRRCLRGLKAITFATTVTVMGDRTLGSFGRNRKRGARPMNSWLLKWERMKNSAFRALHRSRIHSPRLSRPDWLCRRPRNRFNRSSTTVAQPVSNAMRWSTRSSAIRISSIIGRTNGPICCSATVSFSAAKARRFSATGFVIRSTRTRPTISLRAKF